MEKPIEQIFSERLRARRKELRLTQRELAQRISYSEKSISKWESGGAIAPAALLPRLADTLQCSIEELLRTDDEPNYFLGIDGGGTKTDFLLCGKNGKQLALVTLGACNPNDVGFETTKQVLRNGILQVCGSIPLRKIAVFAGLAGGITGHYQGLIHSFLAQFQFAQVNNGSDAQNAVAVALGEHDGIVVIAGTGSIAFTQHQGALHRFGGFGYLLEEGGSGFAIGRDAIRAALHAEQHMGAPTKLEQTVRKKCNTATILEAIGSLYEGGKRAFASFAPLVFDAYHEGDAVAQSILEYNAAKIAELVLHASYELPLDRSQKVMLVGGLTAHRDILIPLIEKHLPSSFQHTLSVSEAPVVHGALRLAGLKQLT